MMNLNIFAANVSKTAPHMPYNGKHCISEVADDNTYYAYTHGQVIYKQSKNGEISYQSDNTLSATLTNVFDLELLTTLESSYPKVLTHCSSGEATTIEVIAATQDGEMVNIEMECYRSLSPSTGPIPKDDPYYTKADEYCY
jgi:hypothetical protein